MIIIGAGDIGKTAASYLNESGRGITIINEPEPFVFKAPPRIEIIKSPDKTGQQKRRERRKNKRKNK